MSQETPKTDGDLSKEFEKLNRVEGQKIKNEDKIRKTLWALEVLKQENRTNSNTTLEELIQIVKERRKELLESAAYAKETLEGPAVDEADVELHRVAKEDAEKAERLFIYMDTALSMLESKNSFNYFEGTLKYIQTELEESLKLRESSVDLDEKEKRSGKKPQS